jgi:Zn-dependent M28 family amino/carboxypeptidase
VTDGSHLPEPNPNPGADDCASGSSVVFETLRVLVASGFVPKRPIEFHWYAGEEEGVYGSNEVANAYSKAQTNVLTYLNLVKRAHLHFIGSNRLCKTWFYSTYWNVDRLCC